MRIATLHQEPQFGTRHAEEGGRGGQKGDDKGLDPSGEPWFSRWGWGEGGHLSERTDDEVGFTGGTQRGIFCFLFMKEQVK